MDNERVDVINEDGDIIETVLKTDAHKTGALHKTVIGCLRYGDDWALVTQAADRQDAGQLVNPVGGHVASGEDTISALLRESSEEIGAKNIKYSYVGQAVYHRSVISRDENHLFVVFDITTEDQIVLGSEAVSIERFTPTELKNALKQTPKKFGDAFHFVLRSFYPEYLS